MVKMYRLSINRPSKMSGMNNLDKVVDFLSLYNGEDGLEHIADVANESAYHGVLGSFVTNWNPDGKINGNVIMDDDFNVLDCLYEHSHGHLRWFPGHNEAQRKIDSNFVY